MPRNEEMGCRDNTIESSSAEHQKEIVEDGFSKYTAVTVITARSFHSTNSTINTPNNCSIFSQSLSNSVKMSSLLNLGAILLLLISLTEAAIIQKPTGISPASIDMLALSGTSAAPVSTDASVAAPVVKFCHLTTPCGWAVYIPYTRRVDYFMKNTCVCPSHKLCAKLEDDLSVSAYVYRCMDRAPNLDTEIPTTVPSIY